MNEQHAGEQGRAMKRRGLLAGAGALVAGLAAKQTAAPVRAGTDTNFLAAGGTGTAFSTGSGYVVGVNGAGSSDGVVGTSPTGYGVYGSTSGGTGVRGQSVAGTGVVGQTNATGNGQAGVYGVGGGNATYGVVGINIGTGAVGVQGQGAQVGVVGMVNNANNTIAVYGNNLSTGANGVGVYGSCALGTGVYGQTAASNQYGILGTTYAPSSTAIAGTCAGDGSSAFSGGTTNPNAYAGVFQGTVVVQGNFAVTGNKSAVIQHPRTGDHRLVYCVESPEAWFEDFGEGILAGGEAEVKLDADFAALIRADRYHVFLTEYDGHNDLCVTNRTASGFEVHATTSGASGSFAWRVVAKRADVKAERLGKFTMPGLPLPDMSKFKAPNVAPPAPPPEKP